MIKRYQKSDQAGFTLVELMVVIVIIGILVAVALPNMVAAIERARVATTKKNVSTFRTLIEGYQIDKGDYPVYTQDLYNNEPYKSDLLKIDNPFHLIGGSAVGPPTPTYPRLYTHLPSGGGLIDINRGSFVIYFASDGNDYNTIKLAGVNSIVYHGTIVYFPFTGGNPSPFAGNLGNSTLPKFQILGYGLLGLDERGIALKDTIVEVGEKVKCASC